MIHYRVICVFFFFNDTATTEIYTLSLHDALPICAAQRARELAAVRATAQPDGVARANGTVPPGQRGRQVPRAARGPVPASRAGRRRVVANRQDRGRGLGGEAAPALGGGPCPPVPPRGAPAAPRPVA